jgi:transposase-like protein
VSEQKKRRSFTRKYKLSVPARMADTPSIIGLAAELGLERKLLYCWRDKYAAGGAENLRRVGRPCRPAPA